MGSSPPVSRLLPLVDFQYSVGCSTFQRPVDSTSFKIFLLVFPLVSGSAIMSLLSIQKIVFNKFLSKKSLMALICGVSRGSVSAFGF